MKPLIRLLAAGVLAAALPAAWAQAPAAPAAVTLVGVVELEAFIETLAHKVQLGAVDVGQALGVNQHFDTVVLEHDVLRLAVVHIFELVGKPGAAGRLDSQAHSQALASAGQVAVDVPCSGFCQRNGHVSRSIYLSNQAAAVAVAACLVL